MEGRVADPSLLAAALARMPRLFLPGLSGIYQIHPRNLCPKSMLAILEMARRGDGETDKMNEGTHIHTQTTLALSLPQTDADDKDGHSEKDLQSLAMQAFLPSIGDICTSGGQSTECGNSSSDCDCDCRLEGMALKKDGCFQECD